MSEKRFSVRLRRECDGVVYSFFDGDNPLDLDNIVDLLNELFEHNLHLQRLIESLAKCTGEPIEDTIERYNNNP